MSRLAEIRKAKCLSQNDLVRISGVSRSLITKYESGERDINKASGETLLKIAATLNCKIEDLLERKEEIMADILFKHYVEWRKEIEGLNKESKRTDDRSLYCTWDCGEASAREDFSNYAGLEEEITFEEMLELEKRYE